MLLIDTILRFSAIALLFLIAGLAMRDAPKLIQSRISVALAVALSAMLITTAPEPLRPTGPVFVTLRLIDMANLVFIWWFGLALYQDNFRLRAIHWIGLALIVVSCLPLRLVFVSGRTDYPLWAVVTNRVLSFAIVAHLIWVAMSGLRDDLVEARRKSRLWLTLMLAIAAFVIIGGETLHGIITDSGRDPEWFSTARVVVVWPVVVASTLWLLRLPRERLLFESVVPMVKPSVGIEARDARIHAALVQAMDEQKLYRTQGLSIGDLAQKIAAPEHRLRALINHGLQHRNFAGFLNAYRIEEAKLRLSDPEEARTPILTIAMDVGFASLATFNRAFRASEQMTPSEYRAQAFGTFGQNLKTVPDS